MQRRFHAEPQVQATEMLLQEQIARGVALVPARRKPPRRAR